MEEILKLAGELGKRVADSDRFKNYSSAQKKLEQDSDAQKLAKELADQTLKIRNLEQQVKPVEVEDKKKLQDLHNRVANNEILNEVTRTQADFVELMRKVNDAINEQLYTENK